MKNISLFIFCLCISLSVKGQIPSEEAAILNLLDRMEMGWTAGNAVQFSNVFAPQHDYTVQNGMHHHAITPAFNAAQHQRVFDSFYHNTELYLEVEKLTFVRKDLAMVQLFAAIGAKGGARPEFPDYFATAIVDKMGTDWKIISWQATELSVVKNKKVRKESASELKRMCAAWYH